MLVGEEFSSFLGAKTSRDISRSPSPVELQFLTIKLSSFYTTCIYMYPPFLHVPRKWNYDIPSDSL